MIRVNGNTSIKFSNGQSSPIEFAAPSSYPVPIGGDADGSVNQVKLYNWALTSG
jgi:hypothetical protein